MKKLHLLIIAFALFYHSTIWAQDPDGYVIEFNGTDNYINTDYYPDSNTKTLMYWAKFNTFDKNQSTGVHDGNDHRLYLGIYEGNLLFAGVGDAYTDQVFSGANIGEWIHLALTADLCKWG